MAPPLSFTVAPGMTPPAVLVTVPVTAPAVGVGVRLKLTLGVVCPVVTVSASVCAENPLADAVNVWLPGASPDNRYAPDPLVVVLPPPVSVTEAPERTAPPDAFVTVPLTEPGVVARLKLMFWVVWPVVIVAVRVCGSKPAANRVRVRVPGASPARVYTPDPLLVVLVLVLSITVRSEE